MDHLVSLEQRAVELAKRGEFSIEARGVNEELTRLAPSNQGAWTRLARCCLELGQLDDATAALDAALQLNPQNTIARNLHIEVTRRRAPAPVAPSPRKRAASTVRGASASRSSAAISTRSGKPGTVALGGIGRAEFTALGHLAPPAAVDALTARIEPLLMALNDRPFAARVVEARNRAGHSGVRLYRRGSIQAGGPGHIQVFQQGGRWEPQLNIALYAAPQWQRDALSAGIGFNLAEAGSDDMADAGRQRAFEYFEAFQQHLSTTWRQHLTDWLRSNGGFVQFGRQPPAVDVLPQDAVASIVKTDNPGRYDWIFVGRWLFLDRADDVGLLTDAPRLVRWIEQTFNDLLPLWSSVYREAYRS